MDKILIESSSDEDDTYTNSVARLRAMRNQRLEKEKLSVPVEVEVTNGVETIIQRRTRRTRCTNRSKTGKLTKRKDPPIDNLESDIEIVSVEKPSSVPAFFQDPVIALSSDNDTFSEDENYEMNIKVFWRSSRIDRLSICRHDSFQKIFQHYADLEKVPIDKILIMKKDKIINCTDTPASLKLSVIDILDGGIVKQGMNALSEVKGKNDINDNKCNIKIQTANKKQSLNISLKKDEQFKVLFTNCAEQLGVNESVLKFYFDGEQINPIDTPETLDLEEEACIDLHISST